MGGSWQPSGRCGTAGPKSPFEPSAPEGAAIASFLFAWELGGGLGHLARIGPVAVRLAAAGHRVRACLKDGRGAERFLPGIDCVPPPPAAVPAAPSRAAGFADLLTEVGWDPPARLAERADRWREILRADAPDVVVLDHAPTALLAAQASDSRIALLGSGFAVPPDETPLAPLRPGTDAAAAHVLAETELRVCAAANAWLRAAGCAELPHLSSLYARVAASWLATWPELDPYGPRDGDYVGAWPGRWGGAPDWPDAPGPRVFAYLKRYPALPAIVSLLARSGAPCQVVVDGLAPEAVRRLSHPNVRVTREPVDLDRAAREADVAIHHAGHGTSAALLRAGKPMLTIPLVVEQFLTARRIVSLGAGQLASADAPAQAAQGLERIVNDPRFREAAAGVARRHARFDPEAAIADVATRLERLA